MLWNPIPCPPDDTFADITATCFESYEEDCIIKQLDIFNRVSGLHNNLSQLQGL